METSGQKNLGKNLGKMKYFPKLAKLYLMGQKNKFSDDFFSEEALSEEQLIKKSGKK